jgi:hypothetical protein
MKGEKIMNTKPVNESEDFSDLEPLLEVVRRWESKKRFL